MRDWILEAASREHRHNSIWIFDDLAQKQWQCTKASGAGNVGLRGVEAVRPAQRAPSLWCCGRGKTESRVSSSVAKRVAPYRRHAHGVVGFGGVAADL